MADDLHEHCNSCYDTNCPSDEVDCPVVDCSNQCGARFHSCKQTEHLDLCPRAVVACVNSQHGCPFRFDRRKQAGHLKHCPASVVCCSHLWFRRNRSEREPGETPSDPPVPLNQLDFTLALRDQRQVGGAEALQECSVDPRPTQLICQGVDIVPRSESLETLTEPCFSPSAVRVVPALSSRLSDVMAGSDVDVELSLVSDIPHAQENDGFQDNVSCLSHNSVKLLEAGDESGGGGGGGGDSDSGCFESSSKATTKDGSPISREGEGEGAQKRGSINSLSKDTTTDSGLTKAKVSSTSSTSPSESSKATPPPAIRSRTDSSASLTSGITRHTANASIKPRSKQLTKLLGGLRGSRDTSSVDHPNITVSNGTGGAQCAPSNSLADSTSINAGASGTSPTQYGDGGDAFQASMGTKLRSHMQSSKRKIAKVFSGKILSRSHGAGQQDQSAVAAAVTRNAMKNKLATQHVPLSNLVSLEVVTHKDSVVVNDDDASRLSHHHRSGTTPGTPDESIRSEVSLAVMHPQRLRERWREEEARFHKTCLFGEREAIMESQRGACDKLFFELPHFYNARHIYPDDGFIQCQCMRFFRRDEIAEHQAFVHAGLDSLLSSGKLYERCPLTMFGCRYVRQTMKMPQKNWAVGVVKGAIAVVPATGVLAAMATTEEERQMPPAHHLTTLPMMLLRRVLAYLDPITLSCLAETCRHMRQLVACCVQERGMVMPVWLREEDEEDGEVRWTLERQRWTLSTYTQPVPLPRWRSSDDAPMSEHLRSCRTAMQDAAQHGSQWKALVGLTDVRDFVITTDSDYESEEEEYEDGSDDGEDGQNELGVTFPSGCSTPSTASAVNSKVKSRLSILNKRSAGSQVRRRAAKSEDNDEFQKSLAVDQLLGELSESVEDDEEIIDETQNLE